MVHGALTVGFNRNVIKWWMFFIAMFDTEGNMSGGFSNWLVRLVGLKLCATTIKAKISYHPSMFKTIRLL